LMGMGVVLALGKMAGATIETDSNSSDFLKLKFGNTRVDVMGGLIQNTVFLSRLFTGGMKTASGQKKPARVGATIWNYIRNKFTPTIGLGLDARDILTGQKPPAGHPQTMGQLAASIPVPLSFRDVGAIMEDEGVPKTVVFELLSIFGEGVQHYHDNASESSSGNVLSPFQKALLNQ